MESPVHGPWLPPAVASSAPAVAASASNRNPISDIAQIAFIALALTFLVGAVITGFIILIVPAIACGAVAYSFNRVDSVGRGYLLGGGGRRSYFDDSTATGSYSHRSPPRRDSGVGMGGMSNSRAVAVAVPDSSWTSRSASSSYSRAPLDLQSSFMSAGSNPSAPARDWSSPNSRGSSHATAVLIDSRSSSVSSGQGSSFGGGTLVVSSADRSGSSARSSAAPNERPPLAPGQQGRY